MAISAELYGQPSTAVPNIKQHSFYPYTDNGGSTLGIAGEDFVILAGDTRSTSGYNINSRYVPKIFALGSDEHQEQGSRIVLGLVGYAADGDALKDRLDSTLKLYKYKHGKDMGIQACAQRLATILYSKRFFPYYVHAILGGLDEEGRGALYSYDPVGSYEREQCRAAGAAASLIMPFLDNQVNLKNQYKIDSNSNYMPQTPSALPYEKAEQLVKDAFSSATERHIEVGDGLQVMMVTSRGVEEKYHELKSD